MWKHVDRDILEGEIIRTTYQPDNVYYAFDDEKRKGKNTVSILPDAHLVVHQPTPMYGVAVGGFGMSQHTMGSAIFVKHVSSDFEKTKNKESIYSARWESYWGIEILDKDNWEVIE